MSTQLFYPPSAASSLLNVSSKTTTYAATTADDVILCSTSGGNWTLSLYAAAGNSGKTLYIKKTTSDTNVLTIDANASETIDGALTLKLCTQYDEVTLVCDGTNWNVTDLNITVAARYNGSTSAPGTTGSPNTITYANKDFDSHSGYSAGTYTVPVSGKYHVTASLNQSASTTANNQSTILLVSKNGTSVAGAEAAFVGAGSVVSSTVADVVSCAAGDTIVVKAGNQGTTPSTVNGNTFFNYLSICRMSN